MSSGQTARVRLQGAEPLENVPRSVAELGHAVLALVAEAPGSPIHLLDLRKA